MEIKLKEITVRDLVQDYMDDQQGGVRGYGGKLDIRPPYQREFVYKDRQRDAVVDTIKKGFPLNVMYWSVRDDGTFEVIDGQQRTISIAQYVDGNFSYEDMYFPNLQDDAQEQILNYKLTVYLCSGTDTERLDWFRIINIAGEKLLEQELRNATFAGPWVSDAKRYFSRTGGSAYEVGKSYVKGSPIRQDYLETAIKWISDGKIEDYMGRHQHDKSAVKLWNYFQSVINWVEATFTVKRANMKGVDWGTLYRDHKDRDLDPVAIEEETKKLLMDDDVTKLAGIYPYILTRDEKYLNIRAFSKAMKAKVYAKQNGICPICKNKFELKEMEADHITPWIEGGKTIEDNCQMLCKEDNRRKSAN